MLVAFVVECVADACCTAVVGGDIPFSISILQFASMVTSLLLLLLTVETFVKLAAIGCCRNCDTTIAWVDVDDEPKHGR